MTVSPNEFIKNIFGQRVVIKINNGLLYKGKDALGRINNN